MKSPFLRTRTWIFLVFLVIGLPLRSSAQDSHQSLLSTVEGHGEVDDITAIGRMTDSQRQQHILENRQLLEKYRKRTAEVLAPLIKKSFQESTVEERLLMLGDPEAIEPLLAAVLTRPVLSNAFKDAYRKLIFAGRPETVPRLAPSMFVEEDYVLTPSGTDIGAYGPQSYGMATLILDITARSRSFPAEVRTWADRNVQASSKRKLSMMREWWTSNRAAFERADYRSVRPGVDVRQQDQQEYAEQNERDDLYREVLRARGDDPEDLRHWQSYPTLQQLRDLRAKTAKPHSQESAPNHNWIGSAVLISAIALAGICYFILRRRANP